MDPIPEYSAGAVNINNSESMDPMAFDLLFKQSVPHILEKIFFSLDFESFLNSMDVSRSWRKILTSERFLLVAMSVFGEEVEREFWKASKEGHLNNIKNILSNFVLDINYVGDEQKGTALSAASSGGHKCVVHFLLDKGANPNKADEDDGWTPLLWAAYHGNREVASILLGKGADPTMRIRNGSTALHFAAKFNHKEVVDVLLGAGVNPNTRGSWKGRTALHLAAQDGHADMVQLLIDRGADPNIANENGHTALHDAAEFRRGGVVQLLLQRGVDPKALTNNGDTPLYLATIQSFNEDVVKILSKY